MPVTVEEHRFLIDAKSLAERALDLDNLWTSRAGTDLSPDDRTQLVETGTEMQSVLAKLSNQVMRVYEIAQNVDTDMGAILDDPSTLDQLTHVHGEVVGERADRTIGQIYAEAHGSLDGLLAYLRDELSTLGPKVTRLAMGEDLQVGDFGKRTRKVLFGLVLVASVIINVLAPPLGALAAVGHAIWVGTNVLCAAVGFASAAQMLG